jgi:hypothetical protein
VVITSAFDGDHDILQLQGFHAGDTSEVEFALISVFGLTDKRGKVWSCESLPNRPRHQDYLVLNDPRNQDILNRNSDLTPGVLLLLNGRESEPLG